MRILNIPEALETEFSGVLAVWKSEAETRRVDALVLSWVKYEKQLRRLFSFFIFQHPNITADKLDEVITAFADNRNLYPETFISGIKALGVTPIDTLLGPAYTTLWPEIERIKKYRNKIMHGQLTGEGITSAQLERDVILLITWISAVAKAADAEFGYDGLRRKTYIAAKSSGKIAVQNYPFTTVTDLNTWLSKLKA